MFKEIANLFEKILDDPL